MEQRRSGAAAHDSHFQPGAAELPQNLAQQLAELRQRRQARLLEILDVARIKRDAFESQVRQIDDGLRQAQQRLARRHPHAAEPDIHFRQHPDLHLRRACGIGKLARGESAIERHRHARAAGHFDEPRQLAVPDHRIRHQQVARSIIRSGAQHDFGLRNLGHRESRRARFQLAAPDARGFVRLGVRAQPQAMFPGILGHAAQIALQDVQIHDQGGRIDFRNVHVNSI